MFNPILGQQVNIANPILGQQVNIANFLNQVHKVITQLLSYPISEQTCMHYKIFTL